MPPTPVPNWDVAWAAAGWRLRPSYRLCLLASCRIGKIPQVVRRSTQIGADVPPCDAVDVAGTSPVLFLGDLCAHAVGQGDRVLKSPGQDWRVIPGSLLERSRHLQVLDTLAGTVREHGHLLLISGEGGVGKTALLREFCDGRRSERVLWGGCDALFTPRPLGPFLDIAQAAGGELAHLLGTGAKPHEVAGCLVRTIASQGPTILVLEDVHWADEATLDVLRLLARPVEQIPALVLVTYRDDELARLHPLRLVLGELRSGRTTRRLHVEPLSLEAVEQLAATSGVDGRALYLATAGNPFFVTEVLAAEAGTIPSTIRDAVLGRAARLGAAARTVLDAVAVTPPHAELWLLEALAGDAASHLDDCVSAGMLALVPGGIAFRHDLARRAVEESVPPVRSAALHRVALEALAAPPIGDPDLARLAHHAEAASDAAMVLRYAPAAARHAAALAAHREAAAQYTRALRFAAGARPEQRAELFEGLSQAHYLTDQLGEAVTALEQALAIRRELGDEPGQGAALCALSRRLWCAGRTGEADASARGALAILQGLPPGHELAMAYGTLSQLAMNEEDAEGAITWATRALGLGEQLGAVDVVVHALNNLGTVDLLGGRGTALLERSIELAERSGLDEHVGRAFIHLGWGITRTRSYDLADRLDDGIDACGQRGLELWRMYVLAYRARCDLDCGRWSRAAEATAEVLGYARSAPLLRILALCVTGLVRARRGDPERWEPLEEAGSLLRGDNDLQWVAPVALARAEAAWLDGRGAAAVVDATQDALHLAVKRGASWIISELLWWRRIAGVEEPVPEEVAGPYALALRGDWALAASQWTELGCPYEAALALSQVDDHEVIRGALEVLQQLGARPAATITVRNLRQRGVRDIPRGPRPTTQSNPAHLTSRELGVLELVVQGMPNAQIAARLFLSTKTVDKHVSAALRKLGAHSRAEASAMAVRLGIVELTGTGAAGH